MSSIFQQHSCVSDPTSAVQDVSHSPTILLSVQYGSAEGPCEVFKKVFVSLN